MNKSQNKNVEWRKSDLKRVQTVWFDLRKILEIEKQCTMTESRWPGVRGDWWERWNGEIPKGHEETCAWRVVSLYCSESFTEAYIGQKLINFTLWICTVHLCELCFNKQFLKHWKLHLNTVFSFKGILPYTLSLSHAYYIWVSIYCNQTGVRVI